jgi:hypothetical protein
MALSAMKLAQICGSVSQSMIMRVGLRVRLKFRADGAGFARS